MSTIAVDDNSFHHYLPENGVTLVEFGAPWCPPCKVLHPILDQIDHKFQNEQLTILTVNCDESPHIAAQYSIMSMPTIIVMFQGEPVEKLVGLRPTSTYVQMIERYLRKAHSIM